MPFRAEMQERSSSRHASRMPACLKIWAAATRPFLPASAARPASFSSRRPADRVFRGAPRRVDRRVTNAKSRESGAPAPGAPRHGRGGDRPTGGIVFGPLLHHLQSAARGEAGRRAFRQRIASSRIAGELPELYFCRDLRGYGWCFRKQDVLTVGIGRIDNRGLSQHCDEFLSFLQRSRNVEVPGKGILGHAYWLFGHSERVILNNAVLFIGHAAGLACAESGQRGRPAIESGLIAAHSIVAAQGDYSASRLELYRELLNARLRQKRNTLESLARFIPQSVREICGRSLLRSRSFCRNIVCDRWFLRVDERPLALAEQIVSPAAATIAQ